MHYNDIVADQVSATCMAKREALFESLEFKKLPCDSIDVAHTIGDKLCVVHSTRVILDFFFLLLEVSSQTMYYCDQKTVAL